MRYELGMEMELEWCGGIQYGVLDDTIRLKLELGVEKRLTNVNEQIERRQVRGCANKRVSKLYCLHTTTMQYLSISNSGMQVRVRWLMRQSRPETCLASLSKSYGTLSLKIYRKKNRELGSEFICQFGIGIDRSKGGGGRGRGGFQNWQFC